jgi:nucleoside-diphosphate-sugar epimerase
MVRSFVFLAGLPVLPFRPHDKIDIVNVDFVADAISTLHMKANPEHDTYHLSSGNGAQSFQELTRALASEQNRRGPVFLPILGKPFSSIVNTLANRKGSVGHSAALMKVFLPYLTWNTVFDNTRVTAEMGRKPAPFSQYSFPLLRFSRERNFEYPYQPWPESTQAGGSAA